MLNVSGANVSSIALITQNEEYLATKIFIPCQNPCQNPHQQYGWILKKKKLSRHDNLKMWSLASTSAPILTLT